VRAIVYSDVKTSKIKKKPDIAEIAIGGSINEKISFIKEYIGKTIKAENIFNPMQVVDIRAITKGKGNQGPVKRFGIGLKQHKSEKGRRKPGSLGPWHPARVTFRTPMAGQTGFFTRVIYNNKIINLGNIFDKNINKKGGFNKYGDIKTDYIILYGSVQGPAKRPLIITYPLRVSKKQSKKNYEFIELR
ncbi:MAG: 50S ribosomal protein L3, partial [Candidatus Pacearchaeota archaeon]